MHGESAGSAGSMTREELDAFTRKLEAFTDSLTPRERALLLQVLLRAGADERDDVEAHAGWPARLRTTITAPPQR